MLPSGSDFLLVTSKPKALDCPVPQLHPMMLSLDSSLCPQTCHLPSLHRQLLWDADAPKPRAHTQSKSCSALRAEEFRKSSQVGSTCHLPEGPLPGLGSLWTGFVFPLGSEPHSSRPRNPYCGYKAPHALTRLPRLLAPPEPLIHHALLPHTLQPPLPYPWPRHLPCPLPTAPFLSQAFAWLTLHIFPDHQDSHCVCLCVRACSCAGCGLHVTHHWLRG